MDRSKLFFAFFYLLSCCSCEITYEKKNKLINGFIDFFNSLPNQIYTCDEGFLRNAQQSTELNSYEIEVTLKVSDVHNIDAKKYLRCTGKVVDLDEVGISVLNHHCEETALGSKDDIEELEKAVSVTVDAPKTSIERKPIELDNEVQTNIAVTSGEQFIAIPREEPKVQCIGCASHVNPQAPGVSDLADIGVRQLDSLEPNVKHTLNSVVDVERQVQVVNGIRYILTLIIDYNSCLTQETETCIDSRTCKITFLEKPWMQLPDGSKYRAVLSNNCTEQWRFGDDGVVIPKTPTNSRETNSINSPQPNETEIVKLNNVDVQARPHTEQTLSDDDLKVLQLQIIPSKEIEDHESMTTPVNTPEHTEATELRKDHFVKVESESQLSPNAIPIANPVKLENLSEDKKKAIDDMLNFFNFAGLDLDHNNEEKTRLKRSYDKDLNVMNLLEKFQKVKKNVDNAKHIYKLAQTVVDYLNEMDLEVKSRILKDVINAEEEFENHQHFYYIQSRVIIPCDKSECEEKDTIVKICNSVLDETNKNVQIINVFCHDEPKTKPLGKVNSVSLDDPVLLKLIKEATEKIESESNGNALKLDKIVDANTQRVSGTLTKFSIMLDYTNCEKTVPLILRDNCTIVEEMGSQICDVTVHERHWLKEKKITYACTERPVDASFASMRKSIVNKSVNDPAVLDMVNEALQYLDIKSNKNSKQVVVRVNSVTTQLVAGFLTDIEFVVGYTTCTNDVKHDINKCKLLTDEPLRTCKAKVWDRTWIEDGRQVDVSCKEPKIMNKKSNQGHQIKKRTKRDVPGAPSNQDLNSPEIQHLAKEALRKYLTDSVYHRHFDVIEIIQANAQVVAGSLTKLQFKISPTSCLIDKNGNPSSTDCKILNYNDVTLCNSTIWDRPWLDFKEINTTCEVVKDNARIKRGSMFVGGSKEQDPNKPEYRQLAEESMHQYLQSSGNMNKHRLESIDKVTTQVVSGSLTTINFKIVPVSGSGGDIISCLSKIWEQLWLNKKKIEVTCEIESKSRVKRHKTLGGLKEEDPNKPEFRTLAAESMQQYLESNGIKQSHIVVSIEQVTSQLVAGTKTEISFRISPADEPDNIKKCKSIIWEQKWRQFKEITVNCVDQSRFKREVNQESYTARRLLNVVGSEKYQDVNEPEFETLSNEVVYDNARVKQGVPGGSTEQDPNKAEYRQLAEESMHQYLQSSGNMNKHRLESIDKVTTQVVSGLLTTIKFKITPVSGSSGDVISCSSEIWEKPWLNSKEMKVNCDIDDQFRTKREITNSRKSSVKGLHGGKQKQDPTKIEYRELAEMSLKHYLKLQNNANLHNVVEVKKVFKKVVSGIIYYIEYTAAPKTCTDDITTCSDENPQLDCSTEVWERPWLNKKEIKVWCTANKKKLKTLSLQLKDVEMTIQEKEHREKRQTGPDTDYVDEDLSFYYAERAIKQLNDQINSNNLHKLITIHGTQSSMHMDQPMVRMYIETAETYCLRRRDENILPDCEELSAMDHQLCLARLWPSPDDDLVVNKVSVVCDDDDKFESASGLSIPYLLKASIKELEKSPNSRYKLVHQGEPQVIPTLNSKYPTTINFIVASTNCSKDIQVDLNTPNNYNCFIDVTRPSKACQSRIWLSPNSKNIRRIIAKCGKTEARQKRSVSLNPTNATADELIIQNLVKESLHKLEMSSANRYKQRVLQINSYSSKITSGRVTTIDFDVAYTSCLKFEWVEDEKACEFLEHLPRRHCISQIWERLWLENGRNIEVTCEEDETPLEAHVEFESAETAMKLANEALKHIEAKYPHPRKQKVIRIFSLEKQVVAGIHYRMKVEVGSTQCFALSAETDCKLDEEVGNNKFCRVNVWLRPWTTHPPNFRVSCDYQEGATSELYHHLQAEQLFHNFITTYKPEYINDAKEMTRKFEIFKANIIKIHELNTHEKGTATYGVTRFADLSYEEFSAKFLGLKPSLRDHNQVPMRQAEIPKLSIPDKFDWRDFDAVTEVKNQGSCGSCWAFSVTGNIEGQWKMQSGQLVSLSEQELVDCDKLDNGCNGGLPDNAYRAIEQMGGLELEKDYPYEGEDDTCSFNKTLSRVKITSAVNITTNETDMAKWLVQNGPISIGINANAMQFYMGGVSHPWKMLCNPTNLDHGVLIVGYGIKDYPLFHKKLPYWTIKNSWGPEWGEQGYYRVFRGDGTCGVNQMASSAVI